MTKYKIGENVIGKITSVKPYALFLMFDDGSKGLLHISEVSDCYVKDIEKYGTIDDEIRVKIIEIDNSNGFLRVSLKRVEECERYSTHDNNKKNIPVKINEKSFQTLKQHLPEWINTKLKEAKGEQ